MAIIAVIIVMIRWKCFVFQATVLSAMHVLTYYPQIHSLPWYTFIECLLYTRCYEQNRQSFCPYEVYFSEERK